MKSIHLILLAVVVLLNGCPIEPDKAPVQFIVKVDSISHSSFAATTDTVTIRLFGIVGSDGCHSFSRFEALRQPWQLDLTVWGQRSLANVCPDVMVYLDGKEYKFVATHQGWFSINIHQPDGSVLRDSIIIK
ncbi:MAG: hypothetical protein Q8K98_08885 [Bacteroidota bacterium]|nr:hypothetical protein [Bacteroidota bacterium]